MGPKCGPKISVNFLLAKYDSSDIKFDALQYEMLVHHQVCKQVLGTTNLGARVELGRLPLSVEVIKSTLSNWVKLEKAKCFFGLNAQFMPISDRCMES